jgi:hypothetical protein
MHYRFTTFEVLVLLVCLGASSTGCTAVHLQGCLNQPIRVGVEEPASYRSSLDTLHFYSKR